MVIDLMEQSKIILAESNGCLDKIYEHVEELVYDLKSITEEREDVIREQIFANLFPGGNYNWNLSIL